MQSFDIFFCFQFFVSLMSQKIIKQSSVKSISAVVTNRKTRARLEYRDYKKSALTVSYLWNMVPLKVLNGTKLIVCSECVSTGAAGAQTRRSLGHHHLHPLILRLLVLCAPADFEAPSSLLQNRLHLKIQIPNACPASVCHHGE